MADHLENLKTSKDSKELVFAAQSLAASENPSDLDGLYQFLTENAFLFRLDSEEAYQGKPERLRLRRVLQGLAKNPAGHRILVALAQNDIFLEEPPRVDLLIVACIDLRPCPDAVVKFWEAHLQPEDGFGHLTVEAIVENGDPAALAVLERAFANANHPEEDKLAWMQSSILTHRNDLPVLESCERLLARGLPEDLRPKLVEVLFDRRPEEWFRPHNPLKIPERAAAGPESLAKMRSIAENVLVRVALDDKQEEAVITALEEIKTLQKAP